MAFRGQAIASFGAVSVVWLLVWKVFARPLAGRKIPTPRPSDRGQLVHEVKFSLSTLAFGTLGVVVISWLIHIPLPLLGAMQGLGLANNVMSHLGYELWPRWLLRAS